MKWTCSLIRLVKQCHDSLLYVQQYAALDDVPKVANDVEVTVPQYLPDDFKTFFRIIRGTFRRVLERISADDQFRRRIATGDREQVPLDKDLLMTLWYLGNLETIRSIADRFNVSKSTFLDHMA
ncbi:hypothetical protein DPMN_089051 [Dreissena polymorpha]|uniref:Uncharacterized protein n=1 Tax=Dreissena polymorpha TaxID=45954 RepID=A0A9D4QXP3_DREPO|nr:hypothetical protein DPMN_089051 [Dreissena polymorpha]